MVQNATARKSKTELFIRKFARIYTPIVVFLAIGLTFLPYFFVDDYVFSDWLYRALIFLGYFLSLCFGHLDSVGLFRWIGSSFTKWHSIQRSIIFGCNDKGKYRGNGQNRNCDQRCFQNQGR